MATLITEHRLYLLLVIGILLISGCVTAPPEIREAPSGNPAVSQVIGNVDQYRGAAVRWGGVILDVENRTDGTAVTVMALPLSDDGEPQTGDSSRGRFIALTGQFLEPTVYKSDRKFTVKGEIAGAEIRKIGEFPYTYPVIDVQHYYLWPEEPAVSERDYYPWWRYDPWYYDPWYSPWYPHHYPYWR